MREEKGKKGKERWKEVGRDGEKGCAIKYVNECLPHKIIYLHMYLTKL